MADIEQLRLDIFDLKEENKKLSTALMSKEVDTEGNIRVSVPVTTAGAEESYRVVISETPTGEKVFTIDLPEMSAFSNLKQLETNPEEALQQVQQANARYYRLNQDLIQRVQTQAKTIKGLLTQATAMEEQLRFVDKMGLISEVKRLKEENASAASSVKHMEAHCKESSSQLEQMRKLYKEAKESKDASKEASRQKAAEAAAAASLRAQKALKASADAQDALRGELATANAKVEELELQCNDTLAKKIADLTAQNSALAKKIADLSAQNSALTKSLEVKLNKCYAIEMSLQKTNTSLQKQVTALEKQNSEKQVQITTLQAQKPQQLPQENNSDDALRAKVADLLKKTEEQEEIERSLNAALQLHISESDIQHNSYKYYIETLKSELQSIKVKKITEANEHTAMLTYMLITGQSYQSEIGYMPPGYMPPGYIPPGYIPPGYMQSGYMQSGYMLPN